MSSGLCTIMNGTTVLFTFLGTYSSVADSDFKLFLQYLATSSNFFDSDSTFLNFLDFLET